MIKVEYKPFSELADALETGLARSHLFDDACISVCISRWIGLDLSVVNVFAPRNHAFFDLGPQRQLRDISARIGKDIALAVPASTIEDELRGSHMKKGDLSAFVLTGEVTQHYGPYFYSSEPMGEMLVRRHFSVALNHGDVEPALEFLRLQDDVFGTRSICVADSTESFVFKGIDNESSVERFLYLPLSLLERHADLPALEQQSLASVESLRGVWSDPCPILLLDESFSARKESMIARASIAGRVGSFGALLDLRDRLHDFEDMPKELRVEMIDFLEKDKDATAPVRNYRI